MRAELLWTAARLSLKSYKGVSATELKILSDRELVLSIRRGIKPVYMIYGKDIATLENITKKLIDKLVPSDARDLNYHFFAVGALGALDIPALSDVCQALPVFAERVVAAVNDLDAEKLGTKDFNELKEIISNIDGEITTVIFYTTAVDLCGGKKSLTSANRKLAEHIQKCGGVVAEISRKTPRELVKYIQKGVEKAGSKIGDSAALRLAERCLSDVLMINNEIDKLSAYRFGGEISIQDVTELVSGQIESDAYRLAREISEKRKSNAFATLESLYSLQKETSALISAVSASFLDLYRAKLCLISGRTAKDVEDTFFYKGREFAIKYAFRDCAKIPIERLRRCIAVLSECDAGTKSLRTDDKVLFEEAITKMLSD